MTTHPDLRAATHVAFDTSTRDRLSKLGAASVVLAADRLIIGPCRRQPGDHARLREAWWGSPETGDHLYSPEVRWEPPVVMWVPRNIVQRVSFWRACSRLGTLGFPPRDAFVVELDRAGGADDADEPLPPLDCTSSVSDHPDDALLERLRTARAWSAERFDRAAGLWTRFTDPSPTRFADLCARWTEEFPELVPLWIFLTCLFPRRTGQGILHPSRLDELLLGRLSAQWQTPRAVLDQRSRAGAELRQLIACTGELFLARRLEEWAAHGDAPAVERAPGPKPTEYSMSASTYRITAAGKRLLKKGLSNVGDAPTLPIGGVQAYGRPMSWALREGGGFIRL